MKASASYDKDKDYVFGSGGPTCHATGRSSKRERAQD
jgi:hypothetical protein